jgi:hypothetical protein
MQTLARLELKFTNRYRVLREASGAEALATLRTAARKQPSPALGGHARPKTMGSGTVQIAGIERTFHSASSAEKTTAQIGQRLDICGRAQGY